MTVTDYLKHYISIPDCLIFFGIAFALIILVNVILFLCAKITGGKPDREYASVNERVRHNYSTWIQHFYELVFSANSILFFMAVYYLIDRFYDTQPIKSILVKYDDFVLLLLIIISCILTSFLDKILIRLDLISVDNRGPIRFMGMIYMAAIFWYIKVIYENDNYDRFITYFLGLMIGRFAYFDASFKDFWNTIKKGFLNMPLLILSLGCVAVLSYYGFKTEFLIKHIGVVTNVYIEHIFICVAIFIIHHIHPERWIRVREKNNITDGISDDITFENISLEEE